MDVLAELLWVWKASIPRIHVCSNEEDFLPSQQWKSSSVVNMLAGGCWSPWAMGPYQGSSAGLCCWQIRRSATALARLALLRRSPFLPRPLYSWAPWVSTHNPHCLGKEVICYHRACYFVYLIMRSLLCRESPLVSIHGDTYIFAVCVLSNKTINIHLLHTSLSPIFQFASSPNLPTKLLAILFLKALRKNYFSSQFLVVAGNP